ncbi:hypothetical protein GGR55DRAFT_638609 [Xylaria sp. FL0064]|nr:hypothetical protein GGR55DRAFT_638609 [Xylaria sp. FL0064]
MYDDPFNWDVDRVICLREQGADGYTILTYADESELCESLGIRTLKHKNTFAHARGELRPSIARRNLRRVAPTPLLSGANIRQAVNLGVPTEVELEPHEESEINICHIKVPYQQRLQAYILFKRYLLRAQRGLEHFARHRADITTRAHDPENDIILPLYGDLDDDADPETWEEVQEEQRTIRIPRGNRTVLTNEVASYIIDEAIRSYIDDWKQRKLPILS